MALRIVKPIYPEEAIRKRIDGVTVAGVELSKDGSHCRRVIVLESPTDILSC
jgi:hypothetical protein